MKKNDLSIIVAMNDDRVIGLEGKLPWHLPEDLKRFKALTSGHAIIMGRKTYDSIGRPLPNRVNIVVTRDSGLRIDGCQVAHSLEEALELARATDPAPFVIGGNALYVSALPLATKMFITRVDQKVSGDAFFPDWDRAEWIETEREAGSTPGVIFTTHVRKSP